MTRYSHPHDRAPFRPTAKLFGIPVGDFGAFATLLISASAGVLTFFLTTFLSIVGLLIYNTAGHHNVTYAASYRYVALPAGLLVLVFSLGYLGSLWIRRKLRGQDA